MNSYKKYSFSAISIKKEVASRFRKFSKQISKSNTEALEAMLNFFDWNELSPDDNLGVKNDGNKKRINAVIAILKNIEKHQTKPTAAMLKTLFEEVSTIEKDEEEILEFKPQELISENEELAYYREQYYSVKTDYSDLKQELNVLLKNTDYIKSSFGTGHYRMKLTKQAFEILKQKL